MSDCLHVHEEEKKKEYLLNKGGEGDAFVSSGGYVCMYVCMLDMQL